MLNRRENRQSDEQEPEVKTTVRTEQEPEVKGEKKPPQILS